MGQERIDVKDVTPKTFNPKTHKGKGDRFNPSNRIYVRESKGTYQKLRRYGGWFLLLIFGLTPWIPYGDRQAILLDLGNQQFNFFGTTLYPQDLTLLALLFMIAAFGLFFLTTFLGRVWCGYLCPQTVWTFMYIWFEEKLEGSANKRRKQDSGTLSSNLVFRKTLKHIAWWAIALITGFTFVGYFVPVKDLVIDFFTLNASFWPVFWVVFFAACTYGNAGWMRSIMCIHMCPYSRFQSAMFDKDTYIVGYDTKRGETRGGRSRKADPKSLGLGDCIDCDLCVQVCPTGIDIRDGLQYECINCGACIDACDKTMDRMGYEKGLISYTTEHRLSGHKTHIMRPKLLGYGVVMILMTGLFLFQIASVEPAGMSVLRDRNQLFRMNSEGLVENTYTLKIINKTQERQEYTLSVEGLSDVRWYGAQTVHVNPGEVLNLPLSLGADPDKLRSPISKIQFILSDSDQFTVEVESRFIKKL
ncbi:putative Cytochrome c oxidase cbb3 type,accessory protein FixG [Vibrio nigripulchritudo SFn27]|uniref:Putative Cytochrome c oxidase cbb3 type, accessory protein FixG n=1 Tax=Vibrio nigripulchritudo TaxID=28173 RepID=U4KAJ9_9VIBR|nr:MULTISPECIES: cytochrome c oxidase accessory protein CcoG [Vibrio]UAB70318.1 cytochrome c oxidase accessory protein CcoG [Vibrio sp. SCSIO 43132]CCN33421.1 putative Cytochrome c oxidase cbb3 type,accessory protein FixG [Vibrio nigripulchritudo AM115]CCN42961.1 putative Cytochrome c oxidase cbb3 type,accessory protein FixG [Vibrio nigripulchritudo FTn2]CCN65397.1 putative Cytochrome c oxidase cbb3 type,accessory protein FixG [Vibrio nigripulchritudo POn4]CCN73804.1 putative Cytochrome c oxid